MQPLLARYAPDFEPGKAAQMILAATGHRPSKLGGYYGAAPVRLERFAFFALNHFSPAHLVSGMALGWDQACAAAAIKLGIPFTAAIPFEGQENEWPDAAQERYALLRAQADKVTIVCAGGYSLRKMHLRNEWMVDRCDQVLALWDGSHGGTAGCILYAANVRKPINNVWAKWQEFIKPAATP